MLDVTGMYGSDNGYNLRIDGWNCGKVDQLCHMGYEQPVQDELTVEIGGFVARVYLFLLAEGFDPDDSSDKEFGD